ncbi:hypothetical protein GIB67_026818 [Kingdonia uniflora]|uniref:Pentatricopeptide repeat-containing protein n=1 Tax=Kingdonia uniflora TaxID=39325 RepID=A0A7J7MHT2_9MAGN|nr:hypothetical protein GIB67_026818 [Kingdonia uniflora]
MLSEYGASENDGDDGSDGVEWNADEIDAISSLFRGRVPQKPGNIYNQRSLPLPLPHKIRPLGLPTSKKHIRRACASTVTPRISITDLVYKNPEFLIDLAKEIRSLPLEKDVYLVLDKWVRFLRKGSLPLTIKELGHMGLPDRVLQIFCWAKKQPLLFPDDKILASTIEILGRTRRLNDPFDLEKFTSSASWSVIDALARGVIRRGSVNLAQKLLLVANDSKRTLDPSIHAKLILELGKDPDNYKLLIALLNGLGDRDDINLN